MEQEGLRLEWLRCPSPALLPWGCSWLLIPPLTSLVSELFQTHLPDFLSLGDPTLPSLLISQCLVG